MASLVPGAPDYGPKIALLKQMYFGMERDDLFRLRLHRLLVNAVTRARSGPATSPDATTSKIGDRFRSSLLTVLGNSGAGKSRMVETALAKSGILEGLEHEEGLLRPAILVSAPSPFNRVQFAENILRALGMETDRRLEPNHAWRIIRNLLPRARTSLIIVDEAQHFVRTDKPDMTRCIRDDLKVTADNYRWPVSFVFVGTRALTRFVTTDNRIRGRNTIMKLKQMGLDRETGLLCEDDLALVLDAIDETLARIRLSLPMLLLNRSASVRDACTKWSSLAVAFFASAGMTRAGIPDPGRKSYDAPRNVSRTRSTNSGGSISARYVGFDWMGSTTWKIIRSTEIASFSSSVSIRLQQILEVAAANQGGLNPRYIVHKRRHVIRSGRLPPCGAVFFPSLPRQAAFAPS